MGRSAHLRAVGDERGAVDVEPQACPVHLDVHGEMLRRTESQSIDAKDLRHTQPLEAISFLDPPEEQEDEAQPHDRPPTPREPFVV